MPHPTSRRDEIWATRPGTGDFATLNRPHLEGGFRTWVLGADFEAGGRIGEPEEQSGTIRANSSGVRAGSGRLGAVLCRCSSVS